MRGISSYDSSSISMLFSSLGSSSKSTNSGTLGINLSDYLIWLQSKVDYGVANQKLTLLVFEQKVPKHAYEHHDSLHCICEYKIL